MGHTQLDIYDNRITDDNTHCASMKKSLPPTGQLIIETHDPYRLQVNDTVINIRFNSRQSLTSRLARAFSTMIR